jgi:hypothetical protein
MISFGAGETKNLSSTRPPSIGNVSVPGQGVVGGHVEFHMHDT